MKVSPEYLADYMNKMAEADKYGYENTEAPKTVIVDFGGCQRSKASPRRTLKVSSYR